ncbi:MAG TPA: hypothetical protein VK879_23195 [Candidatus Sulfomarinibacteraceae bacterium]|nr:hypothetical protein [Candidatus Sulfomarinibacteraceae bacterium]
MHALPSSHHVADLSRQRHKDLLHQADQWRLLQEAQAANRVERRSLWNGSLRVKVAAALNGLRGQPANSPEQMAPC